eukprot:s6878_g4.t1
MLGYMCAAQASQLEPDANALKRQVQLLKDLAKDTSLPGGESLVVDWVATWSDMAGQATTLIGANRKLQGIDSLQSMWKQDPKGALLRAVINTRAKILKLQDKCEFCRSEFARMGLGEDAKTAPMIALEIPTAILTELDSKSFDDAVAFRAAMLSRSTQERWCVPVCAIATATLLETNPGLG